MNATVFAKGTKQAQLALPDETIAPFELDFCNLAIIEDICFETGIVMPRLEMRRSKLMRGGSGEVEVGIRGCT